MFQISLRMPAVACLIRISTASRSRTFDPMLNHLCGSLLTAAIVVLAGSAGFAQPSTGSTPADLPSWVKDAGARSAPTNRREFHVNALGDGITNSTQAIQKAIDECTKAGGGVVTFKPGSYVTGALFIK